MAISLPLPANGEITDAEFTAQFTALLEGQGLITPSQQKNYRSNVTQALKSFDPHHPAILLVALSGNVQTKFISSAAAESLVDRATQLLSSAEWSDIGAGLAVLIGRRVSEILLSCCEPCSNGSILFRDPSKKALELGVKGGKLL